jgi:hypothetical protein
MNNRQVGRVKPLHLVVWGDDRSKGVVEGGGSSSEEDERIENDGDGHYDAAGDGATLASWADDCHAGSLGDLQAEQKKAHGLLQEGEVNNMKHMCLSQSG